MILVGNVGVVIEGEHVLVDEPAATGNDGAVGVRLRHEFAERFNRYTAKIFKVGMVRCLAREERNELEDGEGDHQGGHDEDERKASHRVIGEGKEANHDGNRTANSKANLVVDYLMLVELRDGGLEQKEEKGDGHSDTEQDFVLFLQGDALSRLLCGGARRSGV